MEELSQAGLNEVLDNFLDSSPDAEVPSRDDAIAVMKNHLADVRHENEGEARMYRKIGSRYTPPNAVEEARKALDDEYPN